jgi:hypothetical protein
VSGRTRGGVLRPTCSGGGKSGRKGNKWQLLRRQCRQWLELRWLWRRLCRRRAWLSAAVVWRAAGAAGAAGSGVVEVGGSGSARTEARWARVLEQRGWRWCHTASYFVWFTALAGEEKEAVAQQAMMELLLEEEEEEKDGSRSGPGGSGGGGKKCSSGGLSKWWCSLQWELWRRLHKWRCGGQQRTKGERTQHDLPLKQRWKEQTGADAGRARWRSDWGSALVAHRGKQGAAVQQSMRRWVGWSCVRSWFTVLPSR